MFMVSEQGFPQYDPDSLFNVGEFDGAPFDALPANVRINFIIVKQKYGNYEYTNNVIIQIFNDLHVQ